MHNEKDITLLHLTNVVKTTIIMVRSSQCGVSGGGKRAGERNVGRDGMGDCRRLYGQVGEARQHRISQE